MTYIFSKLVLNYTLLYCGYILGIISKTKFNLKISVAFPFVIVSENTFYFWVFSNRKIAKNGNVSQNKLSRGSLSYGLLFFNLKLGSRMKNHCFKAHNVLTVCLLIDLYIKGISSQKSLLFVLNIEYYRNIIFFSVSYIKIPLLIMIFKILNF